MTKEQIVDRIIGLYDAYEMYGLTVDQEVELMLLKAQLRRLENCQENK